MILLEILEIPNEIAKEKYEAILPVYQEELLELKINIKETLALKNFSELNPLIHKIKGGAASFRADRLLQAAVLFEFQNDQSWSTEREELLKQILMEIDEVVELISKMTAKG